MYHIYQRCLSRTSSHVMLRCNPQMSGTGSGPSASTMKKWPRKQRQGWQKKENLRRQRETTAYAASSANRAVAAQNPGAPHSDTALGRCQLTLPTPPLCSQQPPHTGYKANKEGQPGQSDFAKSKPDEAPRAWIHSASAGRGGREANRCEWEPSHDVGSGRVHGGKCGRDSRLNAYTERGACKPFHRRSCTGNNKGALCTHAIHAHSARTLCTHTLHSYSALILCTHALHSYSALILCTHTLHSCSALLLCTRALHPCSAFIIRTRTQHSYSTPVLYTRTLHSYSALIL
jgi:hypothetical protein